MKIICSEKEKELLIFDLSKAMGCPVKCPVQVLHGCVECISNRCNIEWEIIDEQT